MSSARQLVQFDDYWPSCDETLCERRISKSTCRPRADAFSDTQKLVLARTIEAEIIPRLMMSHSEQSFAPDSKTSWSPAHGDIEEFSRLLLSHEIFAAKSFVEAVRAQGASLDIVFLRLFATSARYLGRLWDQDIFDFADVTIALSRLHQLLRELTPSFDGYSGVGLNARRAFLSVAPGDQHTLGLFIVQEFFRSAGWQVCSGIYDTADELSNVASSEPFDVIGLSVSCDTSADDLAGLIAALRRRALNPAVHMMVGGRFFLEHPELVERVGADATDRDGRKTVASFPT
jgi:methanogenic corrinoid protein MtbC1